MLVKLRQYRQALISADYAFWFGVAFFVLVLVAISYIGRQMYQQLMNAQRMPVSSLTITGDRQYSQDSEVQQALALLSDNESFFSLNVDQVKGLVEQIPWVASASVRRRWPNGLQIHITDQVPVGYWNDEFFINAEGEIFGAEQSRVSRELPRFYGADNVALSVLKGYRTLFPLLDSEGFVVKQINLSQRESWQVVINEDIKLILGRVNAVMRNARIERFIKVYKHVIQKSQAINYVDLRYDTGFAVNWKSKPGEKANNEQG